MKMISLDPEEVKLLAEGKTYPELEKKLKILKAIWEEKAKEAKLEQLREFESA